MRNRKLAWWLGALAASLCLGHPALAETNAAPAVSRVQLTGVTQVREAELLALMKTQPGKAFDRALLEADLLAIEAYYREQGFPLARVVAGYGINEAGEVTIPIEEGRIEKIEIKGAKKTRSWVLRREMDLRSGDVYDTRKLAVDKQRLFDLGFFRSVSISPAAGSDPGKAVLTLNVDEHETGSLSAAFGYTSYAGMVGYAQWSDANFLGTGQTLYLNWQRGTYATNTAFGGVEDPNWEVSVRSGYDLAYFTPWLFSRSFSAGLRVYDSAMADFLYFSQDVEQENVKHYEWRRGALFTLARKLGNGISLGVLGRSETVNYDLAPLGAFPPAGEIVAPSKVQSVRLSAVRGPVTPFSLSDGIPRTGAYLEFGTADTLGKSSVFQKFGVTAAHYVPLTETDRIATRLQLGWSSGTLPYAELYSVGGPQTVRSYSWSKFQGTRMLVLNTEWRHQLKQGLATAAFVDLGYAWPRESRFNLGDLKPAIGLGLRVLTPVGPFRLDYAWGADGGRAHLTMGDSF